VSGFKVLGFIAGPYVNRYVHAIRAQNRTLPCLFPHTYSDEAIAIPLIRGLKLFLLDNSSLIKSLS